MSALDAAPAQTQRQPLDEAVRRGGESALVPSASIAGRSLVTVIAIMTFLASLTAGGAIMVGEASRGWGETVAREATIQVRPIAGRDIETDVRDAAAIAGATPGVAETRIFTKAESERLLEPWLGAGLDLGELPVPRMIVVKLAAGGRADLAGLSKALANAVSAAVLDDHHMWLERLAVMARTLVGLAIFILALVLAAMGLAVAFATRGAMAGNRAIVEVLHFVGAEDRFIARQFQRHFLRLGLKGGLIGGGGAIAAFALAGGVSQWWTATPGGDQIDALFGPLSLGLKGYGAIAAVTLAIALVTGAISRSIVFRHLRGLD